MVVLDYGSIDGTFQMLEKQIAIKYYNFPIELRSVNFEGNKMSENMRL